MERSDIACVSSPEGERGGAQQPKLRGEGRANNAPPIKPQN
jgi:hypothetical protein